MLSCGNSIRGMAGRPEARTGAPPEAPRRLNSMIGRLSSNPAPGLGTMPAKACLSSRNGAFVQTPDGSTGFSRVLRFDPPCRD
jgi:hypothetical protein